MAAPGPTRDQRCLAATSFSPQPGPLSRIKGRLWRPSTDRSCSFRYRSLSRQVSLWTDPPDHASTRDLNQRSIGWNNEFGVDTALTEIAHRAVINDPSAAVRAEPDIRWTIEPARAA